MMYNKIMKNKVIAMTCLLFVCMIGITGCASTKAGKTGQSLEEEQKPPLFLDWKYKGFGQEYPLWAEAALAHDAEGLVQFFPELTGKENQIKISVVFSDNFDVLLYNEALAEDVLARTWVYINPEYEEYNERYAYIVLEE